MKCFIKSEGSGDSLQSDCFGIERERRFFPTLLGDFAEVY